MKNWVRRVQLCHTFLCCFTVPFFRVSLCSSHTFLLYQPCVIWAEYLFSDLVKIRTLSRSSVSECCSGPKNLWQEQLILVSSDQIFNVPVLRLAIIIYILRSFHCCHSHTDSERPGSQQTVDQMGSRIEGQCCCGPLIG